MYTIRTIITLLLFIQHTGICDDNIPDTHKLVDIPGSLNDPMLSLIYKPYYDIQKVNRFPMIIRGNNQFFNRFDINGLPMLLVSDFSSLIPSPTGINSNSGLGYGLFNIQTSPYYLDGICSRFSNSNSHFLKISPSYSTVENGNFTGGYFQITNDLFMDSLNTILTFNNRNGAFNVSKSISNKIFISARGLYGHNKDANDEWIKPYMYYGDIKARPTYGNLAFSIGSKILYHSTMEANFSNNFEYIPFSPNDTTISSGKYDSKSYEGNIILKTDASKTIRNEMLFSIYTRKTDAYIFSFSEFNENVGHYYFKDKIECEWNKIIKTYIGTEIFKYFGKNKLKTLGAPGFNSLTKPDKRSLIGPFLGTLIEPFNNLYVDAGIRYDRYDNLIRNSGDIMPISSNYSLRKGMSFDLSYRLKMLYNIKKNLNMSLFSGSYNQYPTLNEIYLSESLKSIKSAKHGFSIFGQILNNVYYRTEFYFHEIWDIPNFSDSLLPSGQPINFLPSGESRSIGNEIELSYQNKYISSYLSYSLSKDEIFDIDIDQWHPQEFDRTHKISSYIIIKLPLGINLSGGLILATGEPTPLGLGSYTGNDFEYNPDIRNYTTTNQISEDKEGNYFRLNSKISYTLNVNRICLNVYAGIWNILDKGIPTNIYNYDYTQKTEKELFDERMILFGLSIKI